MSIHTQGKSCSDLGRVLDVNGPPARWVGTIFDSNASARKRDEARAAAAAAAAVAAAAAAWPTATQADTADAAGAGETLGRGDYTAGVTEDSMDETAGRDVRGSWMGSMEESDESALERALAQLGVGPEAGSGAGTGAGAGAGAGVGLGAGVDATGDDDLNLFVSIDDGDGGGGVSRRRFAEWARRLSRATRQRSGQRARAATEAGIRINCPPRHPSSSTSYTLVS